MSKRKIQVKKPDFIFECRKCTHNVYVDKTKVAKMLKTDCPECGEEAEGNWLLIGEGDFENR